MDFYTQLGGGLDGEMTLRSVERFDPATKTWSLVADMAACRINASYKLFSPFKYYFGI